jgi:transposase
MISGCVKSFLSTGSEAIAQARVLGIDLAKQVFHVVGVDEADTIVWRKRLTQSGLMPLISQLPPVVIGMEACGGAH